MLKQSQVNSMGVLLNCIPPSQTMSFCTANSPTSTNPLDCPDRPEQATMSTHTQPSARQRLPSIEGASSSACDAAWVDLCRWRQVDIDLDLQQLESERRQAARTAEMSFRERDVVLHVLKAALAAAAAAQVLRPVARVAACGVMFPTG